jgi:hypothetical protein
MNGYQTPTWAEAFTPEANLALVRLFEEVRFGQVPDLRRAISYLGQATMPEWLFMGIAARPVLADFCWAIQPWGNTDFSAWQERLARIVIPKGSDTILMTVEEYGQLSPTAGETLASHSLRRLQLVTSR